ncbi:MAG: hypothetical protein Q4D05_06230 [Acinetobacter sp.]|nr:hypothetical protein [Acinetobacter sp.]
MITKSLKEHGLLKTCYALITLFAFMAMCLFIWRMPEIIQAVRWW